MSNGMPYIAFYTGDWIKDPDLARCSLATRGAWIEILCAMHNKGTGTLSGTAEELSRLARCTPREMIKALEELERTGAAEVQKTERHDKNMTVMLFKVLNRRLSRECHERDKNRKYQQEHRLRKQQPERKGDVRDMSGECQLDMSTSDPDPENTVVNESSNLLKKETIDPIEKQEKSTSLTAVFDFWKLTLNHPRAILDAKRRRLVTARLAEGFTVEQLKAAITGCSRSAFHQGGNDGGAVYDDLSLICRDAAHVEQFISRGDTTLEKPKQLSKNSQRLLESLEGVARRAGFENGRFDSGNALIPRLTVLR